MKRMLCWQVCGGGRDDGRKGSDWVNCMVYVADRLEALADVMEK